MKITIISDADSWKNNFIPSLIQKLRRTGHKVQWVHHVGRIPRGDVLFLLGFTKIVPPLGLARHRHNIVFHESRVPQGKGWSPLSWQVLEGKNRIPVTLLEAVEKVDTGPVYSRGIIALKGHELLKEIRRATAAQMNRMILQGVKNFDRFVQKGVAQRGHSTFYRPRGPADCELNPRQSLAKQFDLLRIADSTRYPAFFRLRNHTYELQIKKRPGHGR